MTSPSSVTAVLAALVPQDALRDVFTRARGRGGNGLSSRHRLVDEAEAARLLGAEVPTLPALRGPGVVERIGAHSLAPGGGDVGGGSVLSSLHVTYSPVGLRWEDAQVWPLVRAGGALLAVMVETADPRRRTVWPRLSRRGDAEGADYAELVVEGRDVGVQVDESGVVHLTWVVRGGGRVLRLALLITADPRTALDLVVRGGLLA